jgi:hypothetical protein
VTYLPFCFQSEVNTKLSISDHGLVLADQTPKLRGFDAIIPPEATEAGSTPNSLRMFIASRTVCEF